MGGPTTRWAGASLRFQEHEFRGLDHYGAIEGVLLDWPVTLAEMEPLCERVEGELGATRTGGIPGLPDDNKVLHNGATAIGHKTVHTGKMAIDPRPQDDRDQCQHLGFRFQG